jgi:hypothetical protein
VGSGLAERPVLNGHSMESPKSELALLLKQYRGQIEQPWKPLNMAGKEPNEVREVVSWFPKTNHRTIHDRFS